MLKKLILKNRSYRRFNESILVHRSELLEMIDSARLSASAKNAQVLKYFISNEAKLNDKIFSTLSWAGYLKNWDGPVKGERPSAYIVQLHDTNLSSNYFCDHGIAAQSILLTATEKKLGGCIIASVKREELAGILQLSDNYNIIQLIAIGTPIEEVVIEKMKNNHFKYWRDENNIHHVPKRSLNEIII